MDVSSSKSSSFLRATMDSNEGTRLESVEEIRRAYKGRRFPSPEGAKARERAFRPVCRAPMGLLWVLDDGKEDGECFRLRSERIIIGRLEGNITIPHDGMMSAKHAELARELEQGCFRWYLADLQSRNGTFVRIGNAVVRHNQEVAIGSRRYRFDEAPQGALKEGNKLEEPPEGTGTKGWKGISATDLIPSLVEITPAGEGRKFLLEGSEALIGSEKNTCSVAIEDDPFVAALHARIYRDSKGKWHIQNNKSLNGVWLKIDRIPLNGACQFQLGEQRFLFRVM